MLSSTKLKSKILTIATSGIDATPNMDEYDKDILCKYISNCTNEAEDELMNELPLTDRCGPPLWGTIHWIAAVADAEKKPHLYRELISILLQAHPCKEVCRAHMARNVDILKPTWYQSCFKHSVDLHNIVNKQLGKPQVDLEVIKKWYNLQCDTCTMKVAPKQ